MGFLQRVIRRQGIGVAPPQPQPEPNRQQQISGPPAGPGLLPARRPQLARDGIDAPFSLNDSFNGPGRHSEQIAWAQSATPLNAMLAQLVPDTGGIGHYRHAHRITNTETRYYPTSPWWPDQYAKFQAPDAYTSLRPFMRGYAPAQLQRTAGGLQVAAQQTVLNNVNVTLATAYLGAKSPTSANQSSQCR